MTDKEDSDGGIARNLADGWHYRPDFRVRLVKRMRAKRRDFCEVMFTEKDPFIRQLFRLRAKGTCAGVESFRWAERCHQSRKSNIASASIRSMALAEVPVEDIAKKLHTKTFNVVTYLKLYFDIRRYVSNQAWLRTIALPETPVDVTDPNAVRERVLLAAAYVRGRRGVEDAMTGQIPRDTDVDKMQKAIKSILVARAFDFVIGNSGVPSGADLGRFIEYARLREAGDTRDQDEKLMKFRDNFLAMIMKKKSPAEEKALALQVAAAFNEIPPTPKLENAPSSN